MNSRIINLSIIVLYVGYICIPEVNALRCYKCDTRYDKQCLTGASDNHQETCPPTVKSCVKIVGSLNSEEYVGRSCKLTKQCAISKIIRTEGDFNYQVSCKDCIGDLCNSADTLNKSKQIGFIRVIVALIIKKILF